MNDSLLQVTSITYDKITSGCGGDFFWFVAESYIHTFSETPCTMARSIFNSFEMLLYIVQYSGMSANESYVDKSGRKQHYYHQPKGWPLMLNT